MTLSIADSQISCGEARRKFDRVVAPTGAKTGRRLLLASFFALLAIPAGASRIKDITLVEGGRDNQLVGYGLVAGLAGDGDSNSIAMLHAVVNLLQRYGISENVQNVTSKNTAAVIVTADIGAFLKGGTRIDATVASLGDAKSLQGGVLLQTPLLGADGNREFLLWVRRGQPAAEPAAVAALAGEAAR